MSLLPTATFAGTTEPLFLESGGVIPGPVTIAGRLDVTGTGNAITVPNGSILAAGVQSTTGFTNVSGGAAQPAQFPLGAAMTGGLQVTQPTGGGSLTARFQNNGIVGGGLRRIDIFNDQAQGPQIAMTNTPTGLVQQGGVLAFEHIPLGVGTEAGAFTMSNQARVRGSLYCDKNIYGPTFFTAPKLPAGASISYPTQTDDGIGSSDFRWDQLLIPVFGFKQDGPASVTVPVDWQTNLTLPTGLIASFMSFGAANSVCNAILPDGTTVLTTGLRTTPGKADFYLMRNKAETGNALVYMIWQNGGGIALGSTNLNEGPPGPPEGTHRSP